MSTASPSPQKKDNGFWHGGGGVIIAAVITAVGGVIVGFLVRDTDAGQRFLPSDGPTVTVTATVTATPTATGPVTPDPSEGSSDPSALTVRRSTTGRPPIKLTSGYGVDLDDRDSPNWLAHSGPAGSSAGEGSDISWGYGNQEPFIQFNVDGAVVDTGGPDVCAAETGYSEDDIERAALERNEEICIRTDENRYSLIRILEFDKTSIRFEATTWDPPFE